MDGLLLVRDLTVRGIEYEELRRRNLSGELQHLRRGAYCVPAERTVIEEHLLLTRAAALLADPGSVVSFGSAAVLHGLPVPAAALDRVHLTRLRTSGGRIKPGVHVHVAALSSADVCEISGLAVTGLDRTFVDLARTTDLAAAVAAGDAGLRRGMDPEAITEQVDRSRNRHGARNARRAATLVDERSESVGESYSRVIMVEHQLPVPELQVRFASSDGFSAVVDFFWADVGVIGEFDGKLKYGRLLRPGEEPGDAVFREKQREDRLRDMGFVVVRWVWADIVQPERMLRRIGEALQRGTVAHR